MKNTKPLLHDYQLPEIISHAVALYHRFCLGKKQSEMRFVDGFQVTSQ
jgi:hypothetical protein